MDALNTATTLRSATLADVPALVALVTRCYRGEASRAGWTTEADLLDGERIDPDVLRADIARPHSRVLIAERGATTVACAHVCRDGDAGYFGMFAVAPELQRSGLGSTLLAECEHIVAGQWRLPALRMTVIEQRPELIDWYRRRGYRTTGEIKPFPYGDPRFGLPKRDDLRFVVLEKSLPTEHAA
ncbi:GNAT family N-acetyltransferase [Thermomonas sp.]|uniref:GNAT family N-acetyltransferase n=1 Tax=Thermomonas sp. TaxID=1971895 RepID=UPI002612DF16|nr:GNAT family N-acetyltransferase [Thermomonas sp.]MCO5054272.1 GNAT family N-acetyltransferase [Thermomonas sp.]